MAKKDYIRTPDSDNRIVDTNLKIDRVFVLPDYADSPDLNDNPDEAGAVRHNNGRMELYVGGGAWKQVAFVGEGGPGGGSTNQPQSTLIFINQTDKSIVDVKIITDQNGRYDFSFSPSLATSGINNLQIINTSDQKTMIVTVITTENGDYNFNIIPQQ